MRENVLCSSKFKKLERGAGFVSTVEEEEMSRNKGDQDLNSAQTMSDGHSLYEILERKAECAAQGENSAQKRLSEAEADLERQTSQ